MHLLWSRLIAVSTLLLVFLTSCTDDFEKLKRNDWNPEMAIPLIDSRFDVARVFKKSMEEGSVLVGDDHGLILVYSGELFRLKGNELFSLSDVQFDLVVFQGELPFVGSGKLLKHIDFDKGKLLVHIEHSVPENVLVTFNMPKTTKYGVPFQEKFRIKYKGAGTTVFDTIFDLSRHKADLTGSNGDESNKMNINYVAVNESTGAPVAMDKFIVGFKDLSFLFLDGYLGKLNIGRYNDSLHVTTFENFKSGSIILEDPKFRINIDNSFGLPISLSFSNFSGNGPGGSSNLGGDVISNGINVGAPKDTTSRVITTEEINSGNSNISNFLSITPRSINFEFEMQANSNNDSTAYNFVSSTSELIGNIDLEIPLKGRLDNVIFEDDYDFTAKEMHNVNLATFKILTKNFFPLGIYMQIYFMDANDAVLDSLITDGSAIFKEAITDNNGFSMTPSIEESYIPMGELRFSNIRESSSRIKLRARLNTDRSGTQSVKIADDNYFELKIGVIARVKEKL